MTFNIESIILDKDNWGIKNYREHKNILFNILTQRMQTFKPLKKYQCKEKYFQVLDFFSGAGGTSLGFASMNMLSPIFDILGGCDINEISAKTYSHNFGTPLLCRDITEVTKDENSIKDFLKDVGFHSNKPTILIGCAPCQGFSSHRKKHWNEAEDKRNGLVMSFVELVKYIKPVCFIMENVPEFLSTKYWGHYAEAKQEYDQLGYTVKATIVNAADFGVPQERFRTIVIGMNKNFILPSGNLCPETYRTVRDAIGNLPSVSPGVPDPNDYLHKCAAHKQSTIDVIKTVPHNGGNRPYGIGPKCLDKTKGFSDVYGRLYWDRPSITITHYARNPASGRYTHPEQDRGLTAREVSRLQSFPDGFEFLGKFDDIYRQIGEAVPPILSCAIATDVYLELISCEPSQEELLDNDFTIDNPVSSSYSSVIAGIKMKRRSR